MTGRFLQTINHPWAGAIYFIIFVVGLPSTIGDDLPTWAKGFAAIPAPVAWVFVVGGLLLVAWAMYANRQRIAERTARLRSALKVASTAFKRTMWPPEKEPNNGMPEEPDAEKWEVLEHSLRNIGVVGGEALPALVGMARAKELEGDRYLYICQFLHADNPHMEFRIEPTGEQILRRHAIVKVEGEVVSNMAFMPCYTSIVSDARRRDGIKEGNIHLLEHLDDGVLTVSVTDKVVHHGVPRRCERDVLRVSLRGFREAHRRLRAKEMSLRGSFWMGGYRPPEFNQDLDAETIDREMRHIVDEESYGKWRREMESHFKR